jgi:hypothetical protein
MIYKIVMPIRLLIAVFCFFQANAQITFSEVMFDVATNEYHDEFVELFNLSATDSADPASWRFSDGTGTDAVIPVKGPSKIPPRAFGLILDGSYFDNSTVYDSLIAPDLPVFTISDNALGSGGLSNTTAEYLSITDGTGDTLTSYRYSLGNLPGHSDEKIDLYGENSTANWQDSRIAGGTPGRKNSVSPADIDVGFDNACWQLPLLIFTGDTVAVKVTLSNFGLQIPEAGLWVRLFIAQDENHSFDSNDKPIDEQMYQFTEESRQGTVTFYWTVPAAGTYLLMAAIEVPEDEIEENNHTAETVTVLPHQTTLHINEIKFVTQGHEPEWLEIFNSGEQAVALKDWAIADQSDTAFIEVPAVIYPGSFKVMAAGSLSDFYPIADSTVIVLAGFPSFNNQEDQVRLLSPGGGWVEIVHYHRHWLEPRETETVSLERINPVLYSNDADNWGPCAESNQGTPGRQNSIYTAIKQTKETVTVRPNPFSPDNDGFEDVAMISGQIPEASAIVRVRIFDIKGRLIRKLVKEQYTGSIFNFIWDGMDDQGRTARIGIYIIFIEALNDRELVLREFKTTVVLAQQLD